MSLKHSILKTDSNFYTFLDYFIEFRNGNKRWIKYNKVSVQFGETEFAQLNIKIFFTHSAVISCL